MERQSNGLYAAFGPLDPVAQMRRDMQGIPGAHYPYARFSREPKTRAPFQEENPFMGLLIVPISGRRGLPVGDDSFQPEVLRFEENFDDLLRNEPRNVRKNIFDFHDSGP